MASEPMVHQWVISGSCIAFIRSLTASMEFSKSLGISCYVCIFAHTGLTTRFHLGFSSLYREKTV